MIWSRNILATDRFNYYVLNHTDLSREGGLSGDIDLGYINWGNYDLVVIDESHNFRNKRTPKMGGETRYDRLMRKIIQEGVRTRVLMHSATPVNNRMADLRNQIAFATEANDSALLGQGIGSIDATTRLAQKQFNRWRQAVLHGADFKALWDRIKHKTTYRVQFDNEALLTNCIKALAEAPAVAKTRLQWRKADIAIGRSGVDATEKSAAAPVTLEESDIELPDILTDLQDKTSLTRRSIYRILVGSKKLDDFKRNPPQFIELAAEIINRTKRMALVDGIKYQRIGDDSYYAQQLFESQELSGYLKSMIDANKSVHEQVIYQSDTERTFAEGLEKNEAIKVYAKLPAWFKISTPLGPYNPDWAVLVDKPEGERLYLVVETKSSLFTDDLRDKESAKINCGRAHFQALASDDNPAFFLQARSLDDVFEFEASSN